MNSNQITTRACDLDLNLASMGQPVSVTRKGDRAKSTGGSKPPVNKTMQRENICDTSKSGHNNDIKHSDIDIKGGSMSGSINTTLDVNRQPVRQSPSPKAFRKGSLKKFVTLRNVGDERPVCTDTLHQKASEVITRKYPLLAICENKGADQLRGNRLAYRRLSFHFIDSISPLSKHVYAICNEFYRLYKNNFLIVVLFLLKI